MNWISAPNVISSKCGRKSSNSWSKSAYDQRCRFEPGAAPLGIEREFPMDALLPPGSQRKTGARLWMESRTGRSELDDDDRDRDSVSSDARSFPAMGGGTHANRVGRVSARSGRDRQ